MRYRVTIRTDQIELRGYVDGVETLVELAEAMKPITMVICSPADDDYNPFRAIAGGQEEWIELINQATTPEEAEEMTKHAIETLLRAHTEMNGELQPGQVQRSS